MEIVKEFSGDTLKLVISGHVDASTAPDLEKTVSEESAKAKKLIFDFNNVEYISSAGLRVLLSTHKVMVSKGGEFVIENVTPDVKNILEMTGFLSFLNVK